MWKPRILFFLGMPAALCGQAVVEYGLGAAAARTASSSAQAAGKGIGGIMSTLGTTLAASGGQVQAGAASAASAPKKPAVIASLPAQLPKPAVDYEDPAGITEGMERAEMVSRFGPSALQIWSGGGRQSYTYEVKDRTVDVAVVDGKVASVKTKTKKELTADERR